MQFVCIKRLDRNRQSEVNLTRELMSTSSSSSNQLVSPTRLKSQKDRFPLGLFDGGSCSLYVTLLGVLQNISIESFRQRSMSISGISEKRSIHSLNPDSNKESRSCCKTDKPMQRGNEALPSNNLSHKWKILCRGNTSVKNKMSFKKQKTCGIIITYGQTSLGTRESHTSQARIQ